MSSVLKSRSGCLAVTGANMSDGSKLHSNVEIAADATPDLFRRRFCMTASAAALASVALVQSPTRAATVRTDAASLPPYGNSTLPLGIRSRTVNNVNGLTVHLLEAGFE